MITIAGKEVNIKYCFATEYVFRILARKSIENFDPQNQEDIIHLIMASIMSAYNLQEDLPVTEVDILFNASQQEIVNAIKEISKLSISWHEIPDELEKKTN